MKNIILIIIILVSGIKAFSQSRIDFSLGAEYWEHTNLTGVQAGVQYSKAIKNNYVFGYIGFGYGEKNGLNNYDIDESINTLLFYKGDVTHKEGGRNVTDDASQVKLSLGSKMLLYKSTKSKLYIVSSLFTSYVSQFYVVDVLKGYELTDHFFIEGPINLIILSHQTFYTGGIEVGLEYVRYKSRKNFTYFLNGGYGIRGTSYLGLGISIGGVI